MHIKPIRWGLLSLMFLIINGCASIVQHSPEEIVRQRVNERWAALIDGRLETAYSYETPEYRELYPFVEYSKKIRGVGSWQKVELENIECLNEKCIVSIHIYVKMNVGRGFGVVESDARAKESWIQHSTTGEWYHISDH